MGLYADGIWHLPCGFSEPPENSEGSEDSESLENTERLEFSGFSEGEIWVLRMGD